MPYPSVVQCPLCGINYRRRPKTHKVECPNCGYKDYIWNVNLFTSINGLLYTLSREQKRAIKNIRENQKL